MGLQDTFVNGLTACMNSSYTFPGITLPGLTNFALANFEASFAGINYVLGFLPPNPSNLPTPPDISLFITAFMGSINIPSSYPSFSFGPVSIPGVGSPPPSYDISAEFKLIYVCITLPFQLIINIVTGIINNLSVTLPTLGEIQALFVSLAASIGIAGVSIAKFGGCLAAAIFNLFSALL